MIKHIMIALVLLIGLSELGNAGNWCYLTDGTGIFSETKESYGGWSNNYYKSAEHNLYIKWYGYTNGTNNIKVERWGGDDTCGGGTSQGILASSYPHNDGGYYLYNDSANSPTLKLCLYHYPLWMTFVVSTVSFDEYRVSGVTDCVDEKKLYIYDGSDYVKINSTTDNSYDWEILDGYSYKLVFYPNLHTYMFTVDGDNIIYNYDACIYTLYNFTESCGNLIPDSEGFYIEKIGSVVHAANDFSAPSGILTISQSPADNIYVSANPFLGQIGWFLDPIVNDTTYTLTNPIISWSLKVIVQNESTGALIDDAMVKVNQSCYCTDGYSVRQKLTTNGHADFTDMSLQDAGLFVMKTGYKILDEDSTGYATFLSGRANFSSKTWVVKLAPSWSENESTFYESNNTVNIFFKNEDGNRTSKILDTDSNVYLYYENNNTNEEDMTLKFQSSSTHTHFIDEQSWNIPYNEIGHKTIVNADFTPWDYSYRAVIYNSSIYGWNITIPLTVRNATKEENQHYENLSTILWFMYADAGKIDYRSDTDIGVHACSNNTTLMSVDIELYKDNVLLCYKNMTSNNFINADFPYYYVWSPAYSYESGSNYSVRMYGFDRTLLETDYVDCYTDDVTRKNKLTIIVKNHYGTNLDNTFIYLEDYGSIPTGINYYASFEGLDNGYYRFKATKPDYAGTGWDDITLSDSDEIVTYTLTSTDSEAGTAAQPQKMDENELQNIYLIIMAFLLIFIIIGGLKYAL